MKQFSKVENSLQFKWTFPAVCWATSRKGWWCLSSLSPPSVWPVQPSVGHIHKSLQVLLEALKCVVVMDPAFDRLKPLVETIHQSLHHLPRALKGLVVIVFLLLWRVWQVQPSLGHHPQVLAGPAQGAEGSGGDVTRTGEHGQQPVQQHGAIHVGQQGGWVCCIQDVPGWPFPPPNRLPVFGVSRKRFRVVAGNSGRFMLLVWHLVHKRIVPYQPEEEEKV